MTDQVTTPPRLSHDAGLPEMREYLLRLDNWLQAREPVADGSALTKFITGESMVNSGLLSFRTGVSGVPTTDELVPGEASTSPADESQPTPASGLTVTPGVGFFFVEIDAPIYRQGGGNGRTVIYAANYSGAGPLPTFQNAVEVGMFSATGVIEVIDSEPGVQTHFWVKAETRHPTLQANPTGGTNGVYAASGLIDGGTHIEDATITNAKIVNLSASKLIAGIIGVSEYIQSTGFVAGVSGWEIQGDGDAEFNNITVRGTIYASAGLIGGASIGSSYVQSTNYNGAGLGWRLDNTLGQMLAGALRVSNVGATRVFDTEATGSNPVLKVGSAIVITGAGNASYSGTLTVGSSPLVSGATMTGSGAVLNPSGTFALGNATNNLSFDGTTLTANGNFIVTGNLVNDAITSTAASFVTGNVVLTTTSTDYASVSLTCAGGKPIYINSGAVIFLESGGDGDTVDVDMQIVMDAAGTPVVIASGNALRETGYTTTKRTVACVSLPPISYTPTAGVHTFSLQVRQGGSHVNTELPNIAGRGITVVEFKR